MFGKNLSNESSSMYLFVCLAFMVLLLLLLFFFVLLLLLFFFVVCFSKRTHGFVKVALEISPPGTS